MGVGGYATSLTIGYLGSDISLSAGSAVTIFYVLILKKVV
jgi:hypothetical protein